MNRAKILISSLAIFLAGSPDVWACAACFGASDSPMAKGMNWGIFSLLAVIVPVLGAIAGFFVFLAKKSAQAAAASEPSLETENV